MGGGGGGTFPPGCDGPKMFGLYKVNKGFKLLSVYLVLPFSEFTRWFILSKVLGVFLFDQI